MKKVLAIAGALSLCAFACSAPPTDDAASGSSALGAGDPVSAAVTGSCSTTSVAGLSKQLVDELNCLDPAALTSFSGAKDVSLGGAVFPYLQTPAQATIDAIVSARGATLTVNSALRTLPQQYLLYQWYQHGTCGIGIAAAPGKSNHESGLAVDVDDATGWKPYFEANGWKWFGSADPVHFDYTAGGKDIRSSSVLAFQKLWNANNPSDTIAEDGAYGTETEKRLAKSPVGGFAIGPSCATPEADAGESDDASPPTIDDAQAPPPDQDAAAPNADASAPPQEGDPSFVVRDGCAIGAGASPGAWGVMLAAMILVRARRKR